MPGSPWPTVKLPEVIDFQEGPGILAKDFHDFGVPLIRLEGLERGAALLAGCNYLDPQVVERRWSHFRVALGDTLLSTSATLGRIAVVDQAGVGAIPYTGIIRMRPRDGRLRPAFIQFLLASRGFQEQVEAMGVGSVIRHFGPSHLREMNVPLPPVGQQVGIVQILGALDDKLELNRRTNETLEAMARALFKSWFVDFDPVRAKAEARAPAGMDAATAALFPVTFKDGLPANWEKTTVGALVDLERGGTYKSSLKGNIGPYLLGLGAIQRNGGFRADKLVRYSGDSPGRMLLEPGDLFVSLKDVTQSADLLGAVARVPPHVRQGRLTQDTVKLKFRDDRKMAHVLYRTLLTQEYREYCRAHATGTTNLGLAREDFLSYPVVSPDEGVLSRFNVLMDAMDQKMNAAAQESATLAGLRDLLLPKLLSGELRVRDGERIVEQAR